MPSEKIWDQNNSKPMSSARKKIKGSYRNLQRVQVFKAAFTDDIVIMTEKSKNMGWKFKITLNYVNKQKTKVNMDNKNYHQRKWGRPH